MSALRFLPLRRGTNIPAIREWQHRASSDSDQIEAWRREIPGCNWGILTGDGLGVIDLDTKKAPEWSFGGYSTFIDLEDRLGVDFTIFPAVLTASGTHLYFRYEGHLPSRVPWLDWIDLKADASEGQGHQVAAPGTVRTDAPGEHRVYELVRGDLLSIPHAPSELLTAMRSWSGGARGGSGGGGSSVDLDELGGVERLRHEGFRDGQRDNGFNTLAWYLVRTHYPHMDLVWRIAWEVYQRTDTSASDPFPWSKVEYQIRRAEQKIGPEVTAQVEWAKKRYGL